MRLGLGLQLGQGLSGEALGGGHNTPIPETSGELLVNGGFETGDFTGWTTGVDGTTDGQISAGPNAQGTMPHGGSWFWWGTDSSTTHRIEQWVDVSAYAAAIDAGRATVAFTGWVLSEDGVNDGGQLSVWFYDAHSGSETGSRLLGDVLASIAGGTSPPIGVWTFDESVTGIIPAGTRWLRCRATCYNNSGGATKGCWDDLGLEVSTS